MDRKGWGWRQRLGGGPGWLQRSRGSRSWGDQVWAVVGPHGALGKGLDVAAGHGNGPQLGFADCTAEQELGARPQMTRRQSLGSRRPGWGVAPTLGRGGLASCAGGTQKGHWSSCHHRRKGLEWAPGPTVRAGWLVCLQAQGAPKSGFPAIPDPDLGPSGVPHELRSGLGPKVTLSERKRFRE